MPDERKHRGPHPDDPILFAPPWLGPLREATADLSWLLSRAYASPSALKVVGDRYNLTARQRIAVMRSACADKNRERRRSRQLRAGQLAGREFLVDGYNVLTTIEAALAGGIIIVGRDGSWRDMASMHGTWRRVEETLPAIHLAGAALQMLGVPRATWLLDQPVSNSGRLKQAIVETARAAGWDWSVEVVPNPDKALIEDHRERVVVTSDSVVLDGCGQWFDLAAHVVREIPEAKVLELGS